MKRIEATTDSARILQQLIAEHGADSSARQKPGFLKKPGFSRGSSRTQPIIAKVLATIADGDYQLHDALLMKFNGSTFESTGQTIQIRHVGTGSVPVNSIVFPEPCSNLGQCFVRRGTNPIGTKIIGRYLRMTGPLAGDAHSDTAWQLKTWYDSWEGTKTGYACEHDWSDTITYTNTNPTRNHWVRKMHPMRFRIDSLGDGFYGGFNPNGLGQAHPLSPITQFELALNNVAYSSVTLGPNSHMTPMTLQAILSPQPFGYYARGSSATEFQCQVYVTRYRIWIDEVDITGIVTYGSAPPDETTPNVFRPVYLGKTEPLQITPDAYESKSIWIDFWVTVNVWSSNWSTALLDRRACWAAETARFATMDLQYADPNANRIPGDKYRFTFSDHGLSGLSSIDGEAQTGWTFSETQHGLNLSNGDGAIVFNWAPEYPELLLYIMAQQNNPYAPVGHVMRYLPENSDDYDSLIFNNGPMIRPGVNPQGSTTFVAVGRLYNGWSYPPYYVSKGTPNTSSWFTNFPASITVSKI